MATRRVSVGRRSSIVYVPNRKTQTASATAPVVIPSTAARASTIKIISNNNTTLAWEDALSDVLPVLKIQYRSNIGIYDYLSSPVRVAELKYSAVARSDYNKRVMEEESEYEVYSPPRARRIAKEVAIEFIRKWLEENENFEGSVCLKTGDVSTMESGVMSSTGGSIRSNTRQSVSFRSGGARRGSVVVRSAVGGNAIIEHEDEEQEIKADTIVKRGPRGRKSIYVDPAPMVAKINDIKAERDDVIEQVANAQFENEELTAERDELRFQRNKLTSDKEAVETTLLSMTTNLHSTKKQLESTEMDKKDLELNLSRTAGELSDSKNANSQLREDLDQLKEDYSKSRADNDTLRNECQEAWKVSAERRDEIGLLKQALEAAKAESARANAEADAQKRLNDELTDKNRDMNEKNLSLRDEVNVFRAREEELKTLVDIQDKILSGEKQ